jgi:cytochrome c
MSGSKFRYTFETPGVYTVNMRATDSQGAEASQKLIIQVGNEPATIDLETSTNRSFYWPGKSIQFNINVTDKEDGSLAKGTIKQGDVDIVLYYTQRKTRTDEKNELVKFMGGLEIINQSDCKSCHHEDTISIGPSYKRIAMRYKETKAVVDSLAGKIIKGGSGKWGETAMSAHPQLQHEEAVEMVKYILSLAKERKQTVSSKGAFTAGHDATGEFILQATYRDRGGVGIGPLVARKSFRFRNPVIKAVDCDQYENVSLFNNEIAKFAASGAYIVFDDLDLSGIRRMVINCSTGMPARFEVRLDSIDGKLIGTTMIDSNAVSRSVDASKKSVGTDTKPFVVDPVSGSHDLYFIYRDVDKNGASIWNSFDLFYIRVE